MSAIIPEITFGTWTIIWSVVVIIVEKILMGRDMGTGQVLMQLFMSLVFRYFVDFTSWILGDVQPDGYLTQLLSLVLGCAIMAFGICIELKSDFTAGGGWPHTGHTHQDGDTVREGEFDHRCHVVRP